MWRFSLLVGVLFSACALFAAEMYETSKEDSWSFAVGEYSELELESQHGTITIITWAKDSVSIQAKTTAFTDDLANPRALLDLVTVEARKQGDFVLIEENWYEDKNVFQKAGFKINKKVLGGPRIEVDITVHMPEWMRLSLDHRFGDVFMGSHEGVLDVKLEHGDFRARDLLNVDEIEMKYGNLKVRSIDSGRLQLGYMDQARIDKAGDIRLSSSSSTVVIEEVNKLTIDSRHDDINVEQVKLLQGNATLSDLQIDMLEGSSKLVTRFGKVYINDIGVDVDRIDLEGSSTDFFLTFGRAPAGGNFEIETSAKKEFQFDASLVKEVTHKEFDKTSTYSGQFNENPSGLVVRIVAKNGSVSFAG